MFSKQVVNFVLLCCFSFLFTHQVKAQTPNKQVIVFVHGAWGGAWSFKKVDSILTEKDYNVYRPTLTGLGEKSHLASTSVGLETHIQDVVNMFLFEDLHDVILVGHSYGGMVITGVVDRVPDRIKKVIYLDAFVPEDGESLMSITGEGGNWIKQMAKDGFVIPMWVKSDQGYPKDVPHPLKTLEDALVLKNKTASKIPTTYILTVDPGKKPEEDGFAKQAERAKAKEWEVVNLESDHNPQMTAIAPFVELLEKIWK